MDTKEEEYGTWILAYALHLARCWGVYIGTLDDTDMFILERDMYKSHDMGCMDGAGLGGFV
jgi:hypothetical protein